MSSDLDIVTKGENIARSRLPIHRRCWLELCCRRVNASHFVDHNGLEEVALNHSTQHASTDLRVLSAWLDEER